MSGRGKSGTSTAIALLALFVTACGGGHAQPDQPAPPAPPTYTIGGTVAGLSGSGLILQAGGEALPVSANGIFVFKTALINGTNYDITVKSQPSSPTQNCIVAGGSGTVTATNVTTATVTCTTLYKVGGTASGVAGTGLVLQLNGGNDLPVSGSGPFTFATGLPSGTGYTVAIKAQPGTPAQLCELINGTGTISDADVADPAVTCKTLRKIGGTVQGLSLSRFTSGVVLENNGTDAVTVTANGTFAFHALVTDGATYNVTIKSQPSLPSQNCSLSQGSAAVNGSDVSTINVTCGATGAQFAFVANTIGTINVYAVQPTGDLRGTQTVPTVHGGLETTAIDPSGQFLYTASNLNFIEAYRLDQTAGTLAQIGGSPFIDYATPSALVVDPTARFLYVANSYGGATSRGSVSAFTIDAQTGALAEIPGSPYTVNYNPGALATDPSGHFLYVPAQANAGQINVTAFVIDPQTGALAQVPGSPFATAGGGLPRSIVIAPDGARLYVQCAYYYPAYPSSTIVALTIDTTTGVLTPLPSPVVTRDLPLAMAITPSGRFLYGTSTNNPINPGSTSAYAVDAATGTLAEISGSPFQDIPSTTAIAVDPLSRYLFVASQAGGSNPYSGAIYVYDIDPSTGILTNRRGPFAAGDYPYGLAIY
jgi:6-phosphogluconolactonase (cycloisomerase 2 family)